MIKLSSAAIVAISLAACLGSNPAQAGNVACGADPADQTYLPERLQYTVAGAGRLHFHTAPDAKCIDRKTFVIPGDALVAYTEYGDDRAWSNVVYTKKDGDTVSGWVRTERLKFAGAFGMNMTPEKEAYYRKAVEAAEAGKLGRP